ncbi:MAG: carbamoyltransferase HypF [Hyphomonadaceae bacterium]
MDVNAPLQRRRVRIRGAVQGVGFRPHVYRLATREALSGWVRNDSDGVLLEIEGRALDDFLQALRDEAPPLARIEALEQDSIAPTGGRGFEIARSAGGPIATAISPDASVCDACLAELFEPSDRRYLFPFQNCTHCGPRYTITCALPYDRPNTTMAPFAMCAACAAEYADPADRRFHAQPTCCPTCGPRLDTPIGEIIGHVEAGRIVALKGLGGFHLICDARNGAAVQRLRARKERGGKPFALMAANVESVRMIAHASAEEAALLRSAQRPIVLVAKQDDCGLPEAVAPHLREIGVMLPHTPLHYLLFHEAAGRPFGADWLSAPQPLMLIMTSANPGGEPLVIGNDEARARLGDIADVIVTHDRDIGVRVDDAVMRVIAGAPAFIRRARSFAPAPIKLASEYPRVLAVGGHLKNTICLTRAREAFLSQHIGALENAATYDFFADAMAHLQRTLEIEPQIVACDLHPDFLSTRFAEDLGLPLVRVQHHHAHIAAVAAEYGVEGPLLGLALDGYGYGEGGEAWGGELIMAAGAAFERVGRLRPLQQPGGDVAAREPWRMGAAVLQDLGRSEEIERRFAGQANAAAVSELMNGRAQRTSSCGRLFDAAAALLGVCSHNSYEGEAAMRLEALAGAPRVVDGAWRIVDGELDLRPLMARLADEADPSAGAALFHGVLAEALCEWAGGAARARALKQVALGGGCFANRVLTEQVLKGLRARGLEPLLPRLAPAGDGGLSLGQAHVAAMAWRERRVR